MFFNIREENLSDFNQNGFAVLQFTNKLKPKHKYVYFKTFSLFIKRLTIKRDFNDHFLVLYDLINKIIEIYFGKNLKIGKLIFTFLRQEWPELDKWLKKYIKQFNILRQIFPKLIVNKIIRKNNEPIIFNGKHIYEHAFHPIILVTKFKHVWYLLRQKIEHILSKNYKHVPSIEYIYNPPKNPKLKMKINIKYNDHFLWATSGTYSEA